MRGAFVALALILGGCAEPAPTPEMEPQPPAPLVYIAQATPLSQTHPGQVALVRAHVTVFSDGLAVAVDDRVPMDDGPRTYRSLTLTPVELKGLLETVDVDRLLSLPHGADDPNMGWAGQSDRIIGFMGPMGFDHQVRDRALDTADPDPAFERVVTQLTLLTARISDEGIPWQPDKLHPIPTVDGGTFEEG